MSKYDDIIMLEHPTSKSHPRMSLHDRAAQFAPFSALTGHEALISETARLTDERIIADSNAIEELNCILVHIAQKISHHPLCRITYFEPDEKKCGGSYITVSEHVKEIDPYERIIRTAEGRKIPINEITAIEEISSKT